MDNYPPGTIGVLSSDLSRYSDFSIALLHLIKPAGSKLAWAKSADITGNCNQLARKMVGDWLWILGDDHVFHPDALIRLLDHDVDAVVPFCLKRSAPFEPVVYDGQNEEGHYTTFELPESGLVEIYAAGTAGMLVRRHVIEELCDPVFETTTAGQNEDLEFCRKIREAGFRLWCDVDTQIGHIGQIHVWPVHLGEHGWGANLDIGDGQYVPLRRILQGPSLTGAAL